MRATHQTTSDGLTMSPCPSCGAPTLHLDDADSMTGTVSCTTCGHEVYAGYLAEAAYLRARQAWLADRIAEGGPGPAPSVARQYGVWEPPGHPVESSASPAAPAPSREAPPGRSMQSILLGLGAFLLVVAAAVFTAVAWPRLGALGQIGVVLGTTAAVSWVAIALRPRLRGTAEAMASLAFGLAVVDLVAAPALGLLPEDWLALDSGYWVLVLGGLATLAVAGAHRWDLRSWAWLGWASAATAAGVGGTTVAGMLPSWFAAFEDDIAAALAAAMSVPAAMGVLLVCAPWLVVPDHDDDGGFGRAARIDRAPLVLAGSVCLALAGLVTAGAALSADRPSVLAATATTALTALVAWFLTSGRAAAPPGLLVGAVALTGLAIGMALALLPSDAVLLWAVLGAGAGATPLLLGVLAGRGLHGAAAAVPVWVGWLGVSMTFALAGPVDGTAARAIGVFLAVVAAALLSASWLGSGATEVVLVAWPGAVLGFAAFVLLVEDLAPGYGALLESWTLPAALLLLVAGLVSGRGRQVSSLQRVGPALSMALLPSAIATWAAPWVLPDLDVGQAHLPRLVVVLVIGTGLAVLGARRHWMGVFAPSVAAVLVAGGAQLWSGLDALPRWVALGLVGVVLVGAGARFEWLREEGRRARIWADRLA